MMIEGHAIDSKSRPLDSKSRQSCATRSFCASCGATEGLVQEPLESLVVFCADCAAPMSSIEFPEYYCDLGGGD